MQVFGHQPQAVSVARQRTHQLGEGFVQAQTDVRRARRSSRHFPGGTGRQTRHEIRQIDPRRPRELAGNAIRCMAHQIGDQLVRRAGFHRVAVTGDDRHTRPGNAPRRLFDQPRLAHARRAGHQYQPAVLRLAQPPFGSDLGQLSVAAHQRHPIQCRGRGRRRDHSRGNLRRVHTPPLPDILVQPGRFRQRFGTQFLVQDLDAGLVLPQRRAAIAPGGVGGHQRPVRRLLVGIVFQQALGVPDDRLPVARSLARADQVTERGQEALAGVFSLQ